MTFFSLSYFNSKILLFLFIVLQASVEFKNAKIVFFLGNLHNLKQNIYTTDQTFIQIIRNLTLK